MDRKEKIRENYYRRMARRQGLYLEKSRARKWSVDNHMGYRITHPQLNTVEAGEKFDLTLDDVAFYFGRYDKT